MKTLPWADGLSAKGFAYTGKDGAEIYYHFIEHMGIFLTCEELPDLNDPENEEAALEALFASAAKYVKIAPAAGDRPNRRRILRSAHWSS